MSFYTRPKFVNKKKKNVSICNQNYIYVKTGNYFIPLHAEAVRPFYKYLKIFII